MKYFGAPILWLLSNIKDDKFKTIKLLSNFIKNNDLPSSFPDVLSVCIIFLTKLITVASYNELPKKYMWKKNIYLV